ncbi:hypothetical protein B7R21_13335 [Subtercola boreus]|uniref:Uncharacterized protein n=1 Tax=Subtercola boreus TaxID=120213 RepID=A0A3E0VNY9_9MICO|nr:hypothetical protein [Subtercola boreus]RFA11431.1 hypothetical protein B7R21_13335 [Subtercola boreus]
MPSTTRRTTRRSRSSGRQSRPDFSRPELTTPWQKFTRNTAVRVIAALALVGGTGTLTWIAVSTTL